MPGMNTYLDWSAYDTYGMGDAYAGIPATGGNYAKAVAVCMNNQQCQREGKGVMCPSYRITQDPVHSTGARVKAFKAALNGELGDQPFAHPDLERAMDLCVSCKGCKKECPSAVDMTLIKTEFLAQKYAAYGTPRRARLFGGLPRWLHRYHGPLKAAVQWRNRSTLVAKAAEHLLGISAGRMIPELAESPFEARPIRKPGKRGRVYLLVDTFTHYYQPAVAAAAIRVLRAAGYAVDVLRPAEDDAEPDRPLCCGRTYLSQGNVDAAKAEAQRMMAALAPALEDGTPIVGLEPSCLLALRDEFYSLSLGPKVGELGKQAFMFEEFLMREGNKGMKLKLKPLPTKKVLVHGHCHQKAFGAMKSVRKVLALIPELEVEFIDASCCGMSGSFGLETEHAEASRQMAELSLLPAVREADEDTIVIADGFSCRHQIEEGSGRQPVHVAMVLARALA